MSQRQQLKQKRVRNVSQIITDDKARRIFIGGREYGGCANCYSNVIMAGGKVRRIFIGGHEYGACRCIGAETSAPEILVFTVSTRYATVGQSVTVTWVTKNAHTLNITNIGTGLALSGSYTFDFEQNTDFEIEAIGSGGTARAAASVFTQNTMLVVMGIPDYEFEQSEQLNSNEGRMELHLVRYAILNSAGTTITEYWYNEPVKCQITEALLDSLFVYLGQSVSPRLLWASGASSVPYSNNALFNFNAYGTGRNPLSRRDNELGNMIGGYSTSITRNPGGATDTGIYWGGKSNPATGQWSARLTHNHSPNAQEEVISEMGLFGTDGGGSRKMGARCLLPVDIVIPAGHKLSVTYEVVVQVPYVNTERFEGWAVDEWNMSGNMRCGGYFPLATNYTAQVMNALGIMFLSIPDSANGHGIILVGRGDWNGNPSSLSLLSPTNMRSRWGYDENLNEFHVGLGYQLVPLGTIPARVNPINVTNSDIIASPTAKWEIVRKSTIPANVLNGQQIDYFFFYGLGYKLDTPVTKIAGKEYTIYHTLKYQFV